MGCLAARHEVCAAPSGMHARVSDAYDTPDGRVTVQVRDSPRREGRDTRKASMSASGMHIPCRMTHAPESPAARRPYAPLRAMLSSLAR